MHYRVYSSIVAYLLSQTIFVSCVSTQFYVYELLINNIGRALSQWAMDTQPYDELERR